MTQEINDFFMAVIELKKAAKRENLCDDDMETIFLELLESAGFDFSR